MFPQLLLSTLLAVTPAPDTLLYPMSEIIVNGTRTPESLLRVPAATSVIDQGAIDASRGYSLGDVLHGVPGVMVQSRAGTPDVRVTIRGFGARGNGDRSNAGSMRGVRIMNDGMPLTEPDGRTSLDLIDLGLTERVEVLRSNSSGLYGNASGGVVNLRTFRPVERPFVELRERVGAFGYRRDQAVVGFLSGRSTGTVSVANSVFDGWRAHSDAWATQGQLRVQSQVAENSRLGVLVDAASNLTRFPGALTQAQYDADETQADPRYGFDQRNERRRNRIGRVGLTWNSSWESSRDLAVTMFLEPKFLQRSERNRFRDFNRHHFGTSATYQARVQVGEGTWLVGSLGADDTYQDGSILFYNLVTPGGTRSTTIFANKREGANAAGGFAQAEVMHGAWSARGTVRYDNLRYLAEDFIDPTLDATKTFAKWTPKGSLAYSVEHHTVYASVGGGVESPAFNEIDPPDSLASQTALNPFLEPMHSTTVELGARGELLRAEDQPRLRYDVAAYQITVRNDIVPFGGGAYFVTAGESRRRGVEGRLDWLPIEHVIVSGTGSLTNNEYVDYRNDLGTFDGNEVPGLPSVNASARARYLTTTGASVMLEVEHTGQYFADDRNTAGVIAPAYTLVNAGADYKVQTPWGTAVLFVNANNIADTKHVASVFINPVKDGSGNPRFIEPGLPRNVAAGLTLHFD